jgi:hypothetical protein
MWVRHWWNGRWGPSPPRRDVYIHASPWRVEARAGGADGASKVYPVGDQQAAEDLAQQVMDATGERWRELSTRPID